MAQPGGALRSPGRGAAEAPGVCGGSSPAQMGAGGWRAAPRQREELEGASRAPCRWGGWARPPSPTSSGPWGPWRGHRTSYLRPRIRNPALKDWFCGFTAGVNLGDVFKDSASDSPLVLFVHLEKPGGTDACMEAAKGRCREAA